MIKFNDVKNVTSTEKFLHDSMKKHPNLVIEILRTEPSVAWDFLKNDPDLIRSIFEIMFYPAPWLGWAPMLCAICKQLKEDSRPKKEEII